MPNIASKSLYNRLLRSKDFALTLNRLALLSSMDCYFLDALGNIALTAPRHPENQFILLLQKEKTSRMLLEKNRQAILANNILASKNQSYYELTHRLSVESETVGYLMLSACRGGDDDRKVSRITWATLARQGSIVSWELWSKCWSNMPQQSLEQRNAWKQTMALYARDAVRRQESKLYPESENLPSLVQKACEQISEHHTEALHLKDVSRQLGVSAEHLSRLFHQSTGLRFREYLAEARVDTACSALENSDRPISEIAHNSGFSTLSRFNQCFKQHRDMTPRDWRKRARSIGNMSA